MATTIYTSAGEAVVVDAIEAQLSPFIGWGVGTGTAVKGDTDLGTPSAEARVSVSESQPAADKNRWTATLTSASTQSISEAGLFTSAGSGSPPSGGSLIIRGDFTPIAVDSGDKIEFTIELEQT